MDYGLLNRSLEKNGPSSLPPKLLKLYLTSSIGSGLERELTDR